MTLWLWNCFIISYQKPVISLANLTKDKTCLDQVETEHTIAYLIFYVNCIKRIEVGSDGLSQNDDSNILVSEPFCYTFSPNHQTYHLVFVLLYICASIFISPCVLYPFNQKCHPIIPSSQFLCMHNQLYFLIC